MNARDFEVIFNDFVQGLTDCSLVKEHLDSEDFQNADYFLKNGEIVAELKCLEKDYAPELQEFVNKLVNERGIVFYGELPFDMVIKNLPDKDELNRKAIDLVSKSLRKDITKANRQIKHTKHEFNLSNAGGLLVVANVNNKVLEPAIACYALQKLLRTKSCRDRSLFRNIGVCLYVSEIPYTDSRSGQTLFPVIAVERVNFNPGEIQPVNPSYLEWFQEKWAEFKQLPLIYGNENYLKTVSELRI